MTTTCPDCQGTVLSTSQPDAYDMTDIVERLREWPHGHKTMIVSEAIDEIERLRAELAEWKQVEAGLRREAHAALAATPTVGAKASTRIERAKAIREEQQCSLQEAVRLERAEFLTSEIQSAASIEDLKTILLSIVNYRHSA